MINIVCLKWGVKYGPEYVNRLFYAINRNTNFSFKFHCFTDDRRHLDSRIEVHKLPNSDLEGWWNKVYLFSQYLPFNRGEKIFYVDLDTLIVDNIDDLLNFDCKRITVLRDFFTGIARTVQGDDNIGSGLMSWYHGDYDFIWNDFIKNPKRAIESVNPHGDQRWIQACVVDRNYWQDFFPNKVVSFKVHCRTGIPESASIICYHGRPSIPESVEFTGKIWKFDFTPQHWVLEHWRDDAS